MTTEPIRTIEAAPAAVPFSARQSADLNRTQWVVRSPIYARLLEIIGDDLRNATISDDPDDAETNPEIAAAGAVVYLYLIESTPTESTGGRYASAIGITDDGSRAIYQPGSRWEATAAGQYPWPTTANAR